MKSVAPALVALIRSGNFSLAELYTFTMVGGGVLTYTDTDRPVTYAGNVYVATGLNFNKRSAVSNKIGMDVGTLEIECSAQDGATIGALEWLTAVRLGLLDGAEVSLDRAYMATFGDVSLGVVPKFQGRVASCDFGRTKIRLIINDHRELLNVQMPRRLYQAPCTHTVFDPDCGLNPLDFDDVATVGAGASYSNVPYPSARPAGWFDQGTIVFLTGNNAGFSRTIKQYVGGVASLFTPLPFVPAPGDTATVLPGCDRLSSTCTAKFNNLPQFGGTEFVPVAETAV